MILHYASSLEVLDLCPFRKGICCSSSIIPLQRVLEQRPDNLVYRLYNLTYDAVKVIKPEFSLSRAEYERIEIGGGE